MTSDTKKGTYVEFPVTGRTKANLVEYILGLGLPEPTWDFHVTSVYSREPIDYVLDVVETPPYQANALGLMFLKGGNNGLCLTLRINCPAANRSWARATALGATWDYPDFKPHITLTYDLDIDVLLGQNLYVPTSMGLTFKQEVVRELDLDWRPKDD